MEWRSYIGRYGTVLVPGERWMRAAFLTLWALAAVLRFWDLPHLAYTHDELSALVRIYPTLGETIRTGVVALDTHPPGVQVFEWIWTTLFSTNEADVKLPFILMGLAAIGLLYRFALAWTGAGAALFLTALMATLQFSVLYSQLARPYAAGLFTTALLADQLTRYLAFNGRRALWGAGIAAVLSAYTHHFALLLAGLMVLTSFFLLRADQRRAFLLMCAVAVLLYLPNVPIFLKQLGLGGLAEWLAKPGIDWVPRHLWWVAHGSWVLASLLLLSVGWALVLRLRMGGTGNPCAWFLPLWGLLPLAIGLGYSIWRAPVIQHSVLLFSFPYLVLALVAGLRHLSRNAALALSAVVAFAGVKTLVDDRAHYTLLYHSKYEAFVTEGLQTVRERGLAEVAVLIDAPDHMIRFYTEHLAVPPDGFPYVQLQDRFTDDALDELLRGLPQGTVFFGQSNGAPVERVIRIQRHFPYLLDRRDLSEGQWFLFSRSPGHAVLFDRWQVASADPKDQTPRPWDIASDLPVLPSGVDSFPAWDLSGREFGIAFECVLDSLVEHPQQPVEIEVEVWSDSAVTNASFVAHLTVGDSTVFYRGGEVGNMLPGGRAATLVVGTCLGDAGKVNGPVVLKTYVYNRDKQPLRVARVRVFLRDPDPVRFGVVESFEGLGKYPMK
jgi:hypothetical protein